MRLRNAPHGHVAAVAPAAETQPRFVDRNCLEHGIYAGHDVTLVAIAEVLHVVGRELLSFAIAAAWIGEEDEVALPGEQAKVETGRGPTRSPLRGRAAVHGNDHGITFASVE